VLATVPLVLVSIDPGHALATGHGIAGCIVKPAHPSSYVAAIEQHCRRHGVLRGSLAHPQAPAGGEASATTVRIPKAGRPAVEPYARPTRTRLARVAPSGLRRPV
jgi:hypothetical protein